MILKDDVKEHFSWEDDFEETEEASKESEKEPVEKEKLENIEKEKKVKKKKKNNKKSKKKENVKKYIWTAVLLIIAASLFIVYKDSFFPKDTDDIKTIAIVNGQAISSKELDASYRLFVPEQLQAMVPKETFLRESLVAEIVLMQEAEKEGIYADDGKIDFYINNLAARMGATKDEFVSEIEKEGFTLEDIKEAYRKKIMIAMLLDEKISSNIIVSEREINEHYEQNKEDYSAKEGQIRASHILITGDDEDAKSIIDELYEKAKKGEDFAELAMENSKCSSAPNGGDLGFFSKGQMVPEFEEAAFSLEIGEISEPVKSQFGYHIIKKGKDSLSFEEANEGINISLFAAKQESALETYVNQLRSKSEIKIFYSGDGIIDYEGGLIEEVEITFEETGDEICKENGMAVVRLFSAEVDPHSQWVSKAFNDVAKEYSGKVIAYNWQIDTGDNLLTELIEEKIPKQEIEIYKKYNNAGSVPTFVFGCRYVRVGNGYEAEGSLDKEEAEFRKVIEKLIS